MLSRKLRIPLLNSQVLLVAVLVSTPVRAADDPGDRYALLVGIGTYSGKRFVDLPGAENDVTRLAEQLAAGGYRQPNLIVMTNGQKNPDRHPSAVNIRKQLELLLKRRNEQDVIVVALAGHGIQPRGKPWYFCPNDADLENEKSLISIDEIYEQLKTCEAQFKLLLVDACRSESLGPTARSLTPRDRLPESFTLPRLPDPPGGIAAFFSCSAGQFARERKDDGKSHGVFFKAVIDGLGGAAADEKGRVTVPDLEKFVKREVEEYVRSTFSTDQFPDVINRTRGLFPILGKADTLVRDLLTNSLGMKLKLIPAGEFLMGSPLSEKDRGSSEGKDGPHRVRITNPFYLGTTEVTQGQWTAVMETTPWRGETFVKEGNDYAATYVSWNDAVEFCRRLSAKESRTYRLPTEAEWEYACRAGTTTAYSFGDSAVSLKDYAWFAENAYDVDEKYAHRVGQKRANAFGLYDMHGNVYEWCQDWYDGSFYETAAAKQANPVNLTGASSRVFRGGCWNSFARVCRSATRDNYSPDYRYDYLGFRVAAAQSP
jgi:formylglycine-generating enzyme required for sulfatase activity